AALRHAAARRGHRRPRREPAHQRSEARRPGALAPVQPRDERGTARRRRPPRGRLQLLRGRRPRPRGHPHAGRGRRPFPREHGNSDARPAPCARASALPGRADRGERGVRPAARDHAASRTRCPHQRRGGADPARLWNPPGGDDPGQGRRAGRPCRGPSGLPGGDQDRLPGHRPQDRRGRRPGRLPGRGGGARGGRRRFRFGPPPCAAGPPRRGTGAADGGGRHGNDPRRQDRSALRPRRRLRVRWNLRRAAPRRVGAGAARRPRRREGHGRPAAGSRAPPGGARPGAGGRRRAGRRDRQVGGAGRGAPTGAAGPRHQSPSRPRRRTGRRGGGLADRARVIEQGGDAMPYETILYEKNGPVLTITLNRPESLNAINPQMTEELHTALDDADADREIRAIILTGAGRGFSAGFDIARRPDGRSSLDATGVEVAEYIHRWWARDRDSSLELMHLWHITKPIIAAVHGWVMGGGVWYALASDITIAADNSVSAQPEVRHTSNTTILFAALAGWKAARRYGLTGDHFDAAEA